ncbi:MAG: EI24 domain-containing protein [Pseudomonadota bacterium]
MIFTDMLKAVAQIGDPKFTRVLFAGVGLTIALLFGFTVIFAWTIGLIVPDSFTLPWIGQITWVDNVASLAIIPVMIFASVFLMVPVASAFTGFFLDDVVDAVEAVHYPQAPTVARTGLADSLKESLRFLGLLIAVNLVAFLLYLIFAPFAPLIFWGLNGLLLGREYTQLVAQRRLGSAGAHAFRKRHWPQIWAAGTLMAVPLTVPILNLFVPILGVATFTHMFHRLNQEAPA